MPPPPPSTPPTPARLLIECPDASGIVAGVTGMLADAGANVIDLDQHTDRDEARFFMRVVFEPGDAGLDEASFAERFAPVSARFGMTHFVRWTGRPTPTAILVTREGHCLSDLLWRWRTGELDIDVRLVIGNHDDLRAEAENAGARFEHVPVTSKTKTDLEPQVCELIDDCGAELVVLARYMQVLMPETTARYAGRIINIHHSFLPAFAGSRPYHQAHARGVKVIGATAHFVTPELDEGPIIAQGVTPVNHRDDVRDLIRKGRDLERTVLADAVRLVTEDRVLRSGRKTIVFD